MKCTKCKKESTVLISVVKDGTMNSLCDRCLIGLQPVPDSIVEIDEMIEMAQLNIRQTEELAGKFDEPDLSGYSEKLAALAFTPSKMLLFAKSILTDLLNKKEAALKAMSEKERLTYILKETVGKEDYKRAAKLKDRLEKLYRAGNS